MYQIWFASIFYQLKTVVNSHKIITWIRSYITYGLWSCIFSYDIIQIEDERALICWWRFSWISVSLLREGVQSAGWNDLEMILFARCLGLEECCWSFGEVCVGIWFWELMIFSAEWMMRCSLWMSCMVSTLYQTNVVSHLFNDSSYRWSGVCFL